VAGAEELANALREGEDLDGWIESGEEYASFRAVFADDVAVQFLAESEEATEDLMKSLRGPVFELVEFAEAVLLEQLSRNTAFLMNAPLRRRAPSASTRSLGPRGQERLEAGACPARPKSSRSRASLRRLVSASRLRTIASMLCSNKALLHGSESLHLAEARVRLPNPRGTGGGRRAGPLRLRQLGVVP
jgi:hypothetical protein